MATVTSFTSERMLEIENTTVVDGEVNPGDGHLILITREGTQIDAGSVIGPVGPPGPAVAKLDDIGDVNATSPTNKQILAFDLGTTMWIPSGLTMDDLTNVDATSPPANSSLIYNAGTSRWILGAPMMPVVGKDDMAAAFRLYRSTPDTSLADGTGIIQLGVNGGANIGISRNVIQCRNGFGAIQTLHLQNSGGLVQVGGGLTIGAGDLTFNNGNILLTTVDSGPLVLDTTNPGGPNIILKRDGFDAARYGFIGGNTMYVRNNYGTIVMDAEPATGGSVTSPNGTVALQVQSNNASPNGVFIYSAATYNATTASAANMHVTSSGHFFRSTSSERFKTDIETLDEEHCRVLEMRPVWYRSVTPVDSPDWSHYGLIAEEVAAIDPRLVQWEPSPDCTCGIDPEPIVDEEGRITAVPGEFVWKHQESCLRPSYVQYDRLVPHLIHIAQEQKAKIDSFEARLAALEAA